MYGLAAIQQANGWTMAGAGASIVLCGLAVLAFLISLLPRLTNLFEPKPQKPATPEAKEAQSAIVVPDRLPEDINAASIIYMALTKDLGDAFSLIDLHRKSRELGLPNPHMSINRFRDSGILVSLGEERFSWQPLPE